MATRRHLLARIIYRSAYALLCIILVGLLLISPGDAIQRSLQNSQSYNVLILIICYVATVLIIAFVYAFRLYINKTALASIPKRWVPIERGDMKEAVYRMVTAGLNHSAAIAYLSRPRDLARSNDSFRPVGGYTPPQRLNMKTVETVGHDVGVKLPSQRALWGEIEQDGWASPNASDLPNLQYSTVLDEIPTLLEAKALTLAPPDPESTEDQPVIDPEAAEILQREPNMSLRQYLEHLADLGVLDMDSTASDFLDAYEYARFSKKLLSSDKFKTMMNLFAQVLRNMTGQASQDGDLQVPHGPSETDIDSDAPLATNPTTPRSNYSHSIVEEPNQSPRPTEPRRNSSFNAWSLYATAPNTPGSRRTGALSALSRQRSNNSFDTAGSVRRYVRSQPSNSSLRSHATSSTGSVIRLATRDDRSEHPFVLSVQPSEDS